MDLLILLTRLEEELKNRYNADVSIECANKDMIILYMEFHRSGLILNRIINDTIRLKYIGLDEKALAHHLEQSIDESILAFFKKGVT